MNRTKKSRNHLGQKERIKYFLEVTREVRRDGVVGTCENLTLGDDLLMLQHMGNVIEGPARVSTDHSCLFYSNDRLSLVIPFLCFPLLFLVVSVFTLFSSFFLLQHSYSVQGLLYTSLLSSHL